MKQVFFTVFMFWTAAAFCQKKGLQSLKLQIKKIRYSALVRINNDISYVAYYEQYIPDYGKTEIKMAKMTAEI